MHGLFIFWEYRPLCQYLFPSLMVLLKKIHGISKQESRKVNQKNKNQYAILSEIGEYSNFCSIACSLKRDNTI